MTAGNHQLVQMYEQLKLNPAEIAEALGLDTGAVILALSSSSVQFRADRSKEQHGESVNSTTLSKTELFHIDDVREAASTITSLMKYSDEDNVRMRASKFIINESAGRHDVRAVNNLNINVNYINDQMKRAREAKQAAREKVIEAPAV